MLELAAQRRRERVRADALLPQADEVDREFVYLIMTKEAEIHDSFMAMDADHSGMLCAQVRR